MSNINYEKWDVHHHIIPEFYVDALKEVGVTKIFGFDQPKWTEKKQEKMMKSHNVTKAIMSISTPGIYFRDKEFSASLSRQCNEYMASLIRKFPDKFGAFATVPLPDVDNAVKELEYSLDVLKLDGICLLSNVSGYYLGNKTYTPFYDELNKRNGIVFIHPTAPLGKEDHFLLNYMYLFLLDTTRTLIDFMRSGYHKQFPNIKFILPHGGGVLSVISDTLIKILQDENPNIKNEFEEWKSQLYLDTARMADHDMLSKIIDFAGINHVLLGTDYIWAKANFAYWIQQIRTLNTNKSNIRKVFSENAKNTLNSTAPIENTYIDSISSTEKNSDKSKIKYHFHCNPKEVIEQAKRLDKSFDESGVEPWKIHSINSLLNEEKYRKVALSFDIPQVWQLDKDKISKILRTYNDTVATIRNENTKVIKAFGAIDVDNLESALSEIDYCINKLKLDGICIYLNAYNYELEEIVDDKILDKLSSYKINILVHPKNSNGIPIANENYLDSVYFVAKMMYLGKSDYLKKNEYILTHTGGIVPFMAQNIGLLYYMQLNKSKKFKFAYDWLIAKHLEGYEYLKNVKTD